MARPEEDYEFECPYCMVVNSLRVDATAGTRQNFVVDCETCCQPIQIAIRIDEDGYAEVEARRENEE